MKKLVIVRRFSQVFFLGAFIYILWSTTYPLRGVLLPDILFKVDPLIMIFISISERVILPGIVFAIFMLILTLALGRFFCGWVCPLGTIIDICGAVALRKRKTRLAESKNKKLRSIKFYIVGFTAAASFLGIQLAWIFDPMVIVARFISLNLIPSLTSILDNIFIFLIRQLNFYGPLYDLYRGLKASFLGTHPHYFAHSGIVFTFFLLISLSVLIARRLWCRAICPLGALYSVAGRFSLLGRSVEGCVDCLRCKNDCRMQAINDDLTYIKGECVLCMDCIYDCPPGATKFTWPASVVSPGRDDKKGITRREFIFLMFSSFLSLGFRNRREMGVEEKLRDIIRPPAALKEKEFLGRCIRCGNCMKVCITNGLQPVIFESGLEGIWTPHLVPETGYCEYNCTLCGEVCPTGAIPVLSLEEKKKTRLGLAEIDPSICIAWSGNKDCIVCQEHCPVSKKAIRLVSRKIASKTALRPYVDRRLCVGCGICQKKCPTRPVRAIRVFSYQSDRT
ncbi:4Fe-4S binding protein [Candidatus Omnitrophota bacterium]